MRSRKLTAYRGNYDTFEKTAAERLRNQRKAAESVALKKQHMQVRMAHTAAAAQHFFTVSNNITCS